MKERRHSEAGGRRKGPLYTFPGRCFGCVPARRAQFLRPACQIRKRNNNKMIFVSRGPPKQHSTGRSGQHEEAEVGRVARTRAAHTNLNGRRPVSIENVHDGLHRGLIRRRRGRPRFVVTRGHIIRRSALGAVRKRAHNGVPVVVACLEMALGALSPARMLRKKKVVLVPGVVSRHAVQCVIIKDDLEIQVKQNHKGLAYLWGPGLQAHEHARYMGVVNMCVHKG